MTTTMRRIEFRGKRIDNGEWVYGTIWSDYIIIEQYANGSICMPTFIKVDSSTVGQLRHTNSNGKYFDGDVYYHAGYGYEVVSEFCELQMAIMTGKSDDIGRIIGNVYDNHELIKFITIKNF